MYGLRGAELKRRVSEALASVTLGDRAKDLVGTFSGGMRRRVEVAKGLLHHPKLLLLDEPSTGLDPSARIDLWRNLKQINEQAGATVLVTTHLMEEAERCSRLAIMQRGQLIACDTPSNLKERIGGDVITIRTSRTAEVRTVLRERFAIEPQQVEHDLRVERARGHEFVPQLIEATPGMIDAVSVGKPTLEDVFIDLTGSRLAEEG